MPVLNTYVCGNGFIVNSMNLSLYYVTVHTILMKSNGLYSYEKGGKVDELNKTITLPLNDSMKNLISPP